VGQASSLPASTPLWLWLKAWVAWRGHLLPGPAVDSAASALFVGAAPLFEKEGDAGAAALVSDVFDPGTGEGSGARSGLAAEDHPIDSPEVEVRQWAEERLEREELDRRRGGTQGVDAVAELVVFDAHPHPDVGGPFEGVAQVVQALGPLGQHKEAMPRGLLHHREDAVDERQGHLGVKEVAHGVDEDGLGLLPRQGEGEHLGLQGEGEAVDVVGLPHRLEALGHPLGIAVQAARADFGAPRDGVPGGFGPLDGRALGHQRNPFSKWLAISSAGVMARAFPRRCHSAIMAALVPGMRRAHRPLGECRRRSPWAVTRHLAVAVSKARECLRCVGGGEPTIKGVNGQIQAKNTIAPGNAPRNVQG